jgi:hypothetical protein
LADVAAFGPFFSAAADAAAWTALADLAATTLAARIEQSRAMLAGRAEAEVTPRVAASIHFLGTVARIVSPPLATTVMHGCTPVDARWQAGAHGTVVIGFGARLGTMPELLDSVIRPLAGRIEADFSLSPRITRGSVASALHGSCRMLAAARPGHATAAERTVRDLLELPWLAGTWTWPAGAEFRRKNCCLFYRVPGGGTCGDCVLTG